MNEKILCSYIKEALFQNGSSKINTWFTIKLISKEDNNKGIVLEVIVPSKGNIKIRKPVRKSNLISAIGKEMYEYETFRVTNKNTLFSLGIFTDEKPKEEVITYECL